MTIITLLEYERLTCSDKTSDKTKELEASQFMWLCEHFIERPAQNDEGVFVLESTKVLKAQNHVGVVSLPNGDVIEILPKIAKLDLDAQDLEEGENILGKIRSNLIYMLDTVCRLNIRAGEITAMNVGTCFLNVLMMAFCRHLQNAIQLGMVKNYESREGNLPVLRGRLDVLRQSRALPSRLHLLACRYDEYTADTPINQIFKLSLRIINKLAKAADLQLICSELLSIFDEISDIPPTRISWQTITIDRMNSRYEILLILSKMFINNSSPDAFSGERRGFSLLFDMNLLFEEYIGVICKRIFHGKQKVTTQGPIKKLLKNEDDQKIVNLRPDITIDFHDGRQVIVDTKWKILQDNANRFGVSQADIYQMFAYSARYNADKVILLYPNQSFLKQNAGILSTYQILDQNDAKTGRVIQLATVDVHEPKTIPQQLANIISAQSSSQSHGH